MADGPPASGSFQAAPAASLIGEVLDGRYKILKLIGEGGMGEVYAAEHVHIEKKYAIKLLRSEIVSNPEAVTRFRQEARSSSSIGHRNIIAIEDFGQLTDGRIYMCMELLNGAPLNDMIRQPMGVDRLLNILIQTGHGLGAAHSKNIVHRDMKPENIFVTIGPNGEDIPKLLDFGIAKVAGNDGQNHLTRTGTIFGTPFYMAPEQALGNPVDARTDIYAVGVIMYEVFAGSLPFQGESFMGILTQHITTEPEPVAQRAAKVGRVLPNGLADIITRCMQKNPAQRFNTMEEVVNLLIAVYRGIAGAGMSTYMEAFSGGGAAQSQPAITPPPMTGALNIGPGSGPVPMPPMTSGSSPLAAPASSASGLFNPAASVVDVPKKSKLGLIIAIVAVLGVGGGITAVVLSSSGDGKTTTGPGSGAGSSVAVDPGSGSSHVVTPPDRGSGSAAVVVASGSGSGSSAGTKLGGSLTDVVTSAGSAAGSNQGTPMVTDAGTALTVATVDAGGATLPTVVDAGTTVVATVDKVPVVIMVKGVAGFEVWENGAKLFDGPDEIQIGAGERHTLVIKSHGYKDKTISVDNSLHKVFVALDRIPGIKPPPPPKTECSDSAKDIKNPQCRKQFCAKHGKEPQWERRCDIDDD